jgi:hypothetical protein
LLSGKGRKTVEMWRKRRWDTIHLKLAVISSTLGPLQRK